MSHEDIVSFVKDNVEPISVDGKRDLYRVSAELTDGTRLPCLVVEGIEYRLELAIRRFRETEGSDDPFMGYRKIVSLFVTGCNTLDHSDIASLSESSFAIPPARMREIKGETSMSWTAFRAVMRDGKEFGFGTTFLTEFFNMPAGYTAADITQIIPARFGESPRPDKVYYREKPFFTCYVEGL